ncbi:hypothetical protein E2C01_078129 [Portunus trituberculatus]|uniref:Uncharacterized protein n=1 Tax=Portunus trituberculatus TaxID=210409 RepID=A0A5B7IG69_PORTR|nr:hypothetical protein [Portunus trituberculatus]
MSAGRYEFLYDDVNPSAASGRFFPDTLDAALGSPRVVNLPLLLAVTQERRDPRLSEQAVLAER